MPPGPRSTEGNRPSDGQCLRDPAPDRLFHGQRPQGSRSDPRGPAGLLSVTPWVAPHRTGAEDHRELLSDSTVGGADHVTWVGEEPDEARHRDLHARLLCDLPDGRLDGALPHIDLAAGQLPGAAVTPAD